MKDIVFLLFMWTCLSVMFMCSYKIEEKINHKKHDIIDIICYIVFLPATILLGIFRLLNK